MSGTEHNIALTAAIMDEGEIYCETCATLMDAGDLNGGPSEDGDGSYWCPCCEGSETAIFIVESPQHRAAIIAEAKRRGRPITARYTTHKEPTA